MKKYVLLSMILIAANALAQPAATYDATRRDLGSVVWNSAQLATFTVKNTGNDPLVIKNISTSCNCTAVDWTKEPIRSGHTGTINVTYDASMLGHFNKQIAVYTNVTQKPTYLAIAGVVVASKPEYNGNYPIKIGNIQLNVDQVEFDNVNKGDIPQKTIEIFNGGNQTYEPELMHMPKYLSAQPVPGQLRPGHGGKIIVTLDSRELINMGLTQTPVYLSRFPGDKVGKENEIDVSAVLLPAFSDLTEQDIATAPQIAVSTNEIDLGSAKGKNKIKTSVTITNKGKSTLNIRSLQVFNTALNVDVKRKIEAGQSTKLNITVLARYLGRSKSRLRVLMITNDPKQPKVTIDVKISN